VRQEVRAARFLGERKHGASAEPDRKAEPRPARRVLAQHEVQRDQGEAGRRMRTGEACRMTQLVRPVGEQRDIGKPAAEGCEIPGAVDVGDLFQQADEAVRQRERQHKIKECAPVSRQRGDPPAERPGQQRTETDRAHRIAATRMHDSVRPECVAGDPAAGGGIVEHPRHHEIEMQPGKQEHRRDPGCERPPDMTAQKRRVHPRPVHPAGARVRAAGHGPSMPATHTPCRHRLIGPARAV